VATRSTGAILVSRHVECAWCCSGAAGERWCSVVAGEWCCSVVAGDWATRSEMLASIEIRTPYPTSSDVFQSPKQNSKPKRVRLFSLKCGKRVLRALASSFASSFRKHHCRWDRLYLHTDLSLLLSLALSLSLSRRSQPTRSALTRSWSKFALKASLHYTWNMSRTTFSRTSSSIPHTLSTTLPPPSSSWNISHTRTQESVTWIETRANTLHM